MNELMNYFHTVNLLNQMNIAYQAGYEAAMKGNLKEVTSALLDECVNMSYAMGIKDGVKDSAKRND